MRTRSVAILTALACAAAALLLAPAPSASARATGSHLTGVVVFEKNYRNTFRSALTWKVYRVRDGARTLLVSRRWRAGSGYFRDSTNACVKNRGWLPDGTYRPRLYADYGGSLIKGRAIYLGAKRCGNGTLRTDLFIHTEQGAGSRQCADRPGDQVCRWEYPKINDYRSYGCVKLSPHDLKELYTAWRRYFPLGSPDNVRVRVR